MSIEFIAEWLSRVLVIIDLGFIQMSNVIFLGSLLRSHLQKEVLKVVLVCNFATIEPRINFEV